MRVAGIFDFIGSAVDDVTAEFSRRANEFMAVYQRLVERAEWAQGSAYAAEYQDVRSAAETVRSNIEYVAGLIRTAMEYAGIESPQQLQGLGFVQLIPIALVAAAIAAVTETLARMYAFLETSQTDFKKWQIEHGITPKPEKGTVESFSDIAMWTVLGIAAVIALPELMKRWGRR